MISRRSILGFLGLAPAAAVAAQIPVSEAAKASVPLPGGRRIPVDQLSALDANLGTASAGVIRSRDGKTVIDLGAKTLTLRI